MEAPHLRGVVEGLLFPLLRHAPLRMHLLILYHLLRRWQVDSPPQRHPRPTVPVNVRRSLGLRVPFSLRLVYGGLLALGEKEKNQNW